MNPRSCKYCFFHDQCKSSKVCQDYYDPESGYDDELTIEEGRHEYYCELEEYYGEWQIEL